MLEGVWTKSVKTLVSDYYVQMLLKENIFKCFCTTIQHHFYAKVELLLKYQDKSVQHQLNDKADR